MKKCALIFFLLISCQIHAYECTANDFNFEHDYKKNIKSENIIKIKCSLHQKNYEIKNFSNVFDDNLDKSLRQFQKDNGFVVNGKYDKLMWVNLNSSDLYRQKLLKLSFINFYKFLNRIDYFQNKFIVVNIPAYTLYAFEKDTNTDEFKLKFASKIIVGKPTLQTPIEYMYITHLKFNPNWTLPYSSLKEYYIFDKTTGSKKLDKERILKLGYKMDDNNQVYQPKGINNALGRLKFETDSKDAIYLHDTNKKYLFNNNMADFSSGCIRVKEYKKMAYWLKNESVVNKWLNQDETHFVRLDKEVRVYIVYIPANLKHNSFIFAGVKNDDDEYNLEDYIFYPDIYNMLSDSFI